MMATLLLAGARYGHAYTHASYSYAHHSGGFGHMVANAAVHATVWMLLRELFHALGPVGSIAVGALILGVAWLYLRGRR